MGNCQDNPKSLHDIDAEQQQSHLMNHWRNLPTNDKRRTFQQQINKVNVGQVIKIYKRSSFSTASKSSNQLGSSNQSDRFSSVIDYHPLSSDAVINKQQILENKKQYDTLGLTAIKNGQVAVFIMAGSQSPQLNLDTPIGLYDIGLDSACTIFQILVNKLKRLNVMSGVQDSHKIKLYIMTNTQNKNQIKNYFKSKNYFQYGLNNVFFFSQPVEPVVDQHGKIVLKTQSTIYMSPRGNGAIYNEIKDKKLLQHLQNQGIKYLFFGPVNNLLLKIADPCSLGYLIKQKCEVVATCFQSNQDCFGYFGMSSTKRVKVYESQKVINPNKKWANTGSCFMSYQFLNRIVNDPVFIQKMQDHYHDVVKQATVFNTSLNTKATQKCLFFQCFYHQAFSQAKKLAILEIYPQKQMAPIKRSGHGKYSLSHARDSLWSFHKKLALQAGIQLIGEGHVEIHPGLSYQGENLKQLIQKNEVKSSLKLPAFIF